MRCDRALRAAGRRRGDDIAKRFVVLGRRRAPAFHLRRLSCTRPSSGSRNSSQGSHLERGITLTSGNSRCAALGRSPPLRVVVRRMISPRRSMPARARAPATMKESSGDEATKTCAPGTRRGRSLTAHSWKNVASCASMARSQGGEPRYLGTADGRQTTEECAIRRRVAHEAFAVALVCIRAVHTADR